MRRKGTQNIKSVNADASFSLLDWEIILFLQGAYNVIKRKFYLMGNQGLYFKKGELFIAKPIDWELIESKDLVHAFSTRTQ